MSLGIDVEHPVPHVHTQNGLAEVYAWSHAILHAISLVRLRPVANHQYSSVQ
jgi:hypothetical protein